MVLEFIVETVRSLAQLNSILLTVVFLVSMPWVPSNSCTTATSLSISRTCPNLFSPEDVLTSTSSM